MEIIKSTNVFQILFTGPGNNREDEHSKPPCSGNDVAELTDQFKNFKLGCAPETGTQTILSYNVRVFEMILEWKG